MNRSHGSHWQKVHHHHWHRPHWGHGWHGQPWHGHRFNPLPGLFMLGLLFFVFGGFKFWVIPLIFFVIMPMFAWKSKGMGWGCSPENTMDADGDGDFERGTMKPKNGDSAAKRKNDDDPFYPEII